MGSVMHAFWEMLLTGYGLAILAVTVGAAVGLAVFAWWSRRID